MAPIRLNSVSQDVLLSPISCVSLSVKRLFLANFLGGLFSPVMEMGYKICILIVVQVAN